jgi:putative flippase GtrA
MNNDEVAFSVSAIRVVKFALIGGIGFLIEASIITSVVAAGLSTAVYARALSFPSAVFVTWLLNRRITFSSRSPVVLEFGRYFMTQALGALANLGIYWWLLSTYAEFERNPILALAIAAIVGLLVNYTLSALWVFKSRPGYQ